MEQLIEAVLALVIFVFGGYCLLYSGGAVKEHPVRWAAVKIGEALGWALRLPALVIAGVAKGLFGRSRRRRIR